MPAAVTLKDLGGRTCALVADFALGGDVEAGEAVEEGGLAGAVGADEADDLAAVDGEVDVAYGGEAAEAHGDAAGVEDGLAGGAGVGGGVLGGGVGSHRGQAPALLRTAGASGLFVEFELAAPVRDEALGAEAHQQDEREAEGEELVVVQELELGRDQVEQCGADEGAADGAHAAEDDRGEEEGRVGGDDVRRTGTARGSRCR